MAAPDAEDCRWSRWDGKEKGEALHYPAKLSQESIRKITCRNKECSKMRSVSCFWVEYRCMGQTADILCTDMSWQEGNAKRYQGRKKKILLHAAFFQKVKVAQSCPTLFSTMDSIVHGILQARILEWIAFPFSRRSSQPRGITQVFLIAGGSFPAEPQRRPIISV